MTSFIKPLALDDRHAIIDIFNHYVENSFAAYPEEKVPYAFYDTFLRMSTGFPRGTMRDEKGEVIGFGLLRPYSPIPTFSATAEISYFIKPGYTGQGRGAVLLQYLIEGAVEKGIQTILAGVSSLNEGSLRFHQKNGFVECGRFRNIGRKWGRPFDVVYFQRIL
jgi:phosphinothricin acetyltransferase